MIQGLAWLGGLKKNQHQIHIYALLINQMIDMLVSRSAADAMVKTWHQVYIYFQIR